MPWRAFDIHYRRWINTPQSEAISHESMKQFFKTLLVADDDTKAKPQ
jgi:hypothetical protein